MAKEQTDGSSTLTLRLPDALAATHGKHVVIPNVRFGYGHAEIVAALRSSRLVKTKVVDDNGNQKTFTRRVGQPISYRFVRDDKGWRVFASVESQPVDVTTRQDCGAIGIDLNAGHLGYAEIDRFGNPVAATRTTTVHGNSRNQIDALVGDALVNIAETDQAVRTSKTQAGVVGEVRVKIAKAAVAPECIPLVTYGKSENQAKALIGDVCVRIAERARIAGKPLVVEKLDFQRKKAELEGESHKHARMLSSFACNQTLSGLKSACFRAGVEVIEVNPTFTSVIGAVNYAATRGLSTHQAAAIAIARRGLELRESPAVRGAAIVPVRNGGHVAFALPARNRAKHVWL